MNSFQPVRTIRSQVYQAIKEQIFNGSYPPGFWLQEQEIAAALQVSRSPVREALRQIVADGLADEIPNKGVFVRRLTGRDVEEIFELRVILESHAIRQGYQQCTEIQREQLERLRSEMELAHSQGNSVKYTELDDQLHLLVMEQGGNRLIMDIYRRVHNMVQQFRLYSLMDEERFQDSLAEHEGTIAAILAGDCEKAVKINCTHLDQAREKIYQVIARMNWTE